MHQFIKWLLFGCSSTIEIEEMSIPPEFNETIIIITLNKIFIFGLNATRDFFYEICSKLNNVELFITSKKEEENSDKLQILKISKFVQWTSQVSKFGIPLDYEQSQNIIKLEKWPIIAATGLDSLKLGFFTMNHTIVDIRKDLEVLYHRIDLDACANLINSKTNLLESTITDFYMYFEREPVNKRLERSEENMNENQNLELIRLNYMSSKKTIFEHLTDLPDPRVLYGTNSNNNFENGCSTEALYKTTFDFKIPAFHMTYENMDPITGIRIGRSLFLYNLQETYLDLNNETFKYDFIPSLMYKESFYLFNLYYILVSFARKNQFDIILNKISIKKAKEILAKEFNDYIMKNYSKDYFDYLINEEKILIDIREYRLLEKAIQNKNNIIDNKIIILRFELKEILSAISHRRVGSLVFADSFLYCYSELFNLTSDILPFKFLMTTTKHFKTEDYNHHQILNTVSKIKIKDIEYKALSFYKDEYNIPYIFPDSHEVGLDHNQMFIFYSGKINVYEDYIVFNDSAIGCMIISFENIKQFSYMEELKYTVMIFEFEDSKSLPLSGILKNELIVYFRGNTERYRAYARSIIDFLRDNQKMRGKVGVISKEKYFEYEIVIKTMSENEYENLNYISNSFNLTNINDVLNEMYEYEYLKFNQGNKFYSFSDYKKMKIEAMEEIENEEEPSSNTKKKIMFIFGTDLRDVGNMTDKIVDLAKKSSVKTTTIIPPLFLFNFVSKKSIEECEEAITNYYIDKLSESSTKNGILLVCVYHSCNVLKMLHDIIANLVDFHQNYEILNISYTINYSNYKSDNHKDIINKDYYYEDIINYIFIDEGVLKQEKISKYNKIIALSNPYSKLYNHRSFYLNQKEMKKIFETRRIGKKMLDFYFAYYLNLECSKVITQNCFIPFTYMCKENLLKTFLKDAINYPIKILFGDCEIFPTKDQDEEKFSQSNIEADEDYEKYLIKLATIDKLKAVEPFFTHIVGNCVFIKDNKPTNEVFSFYANYKEIELSPSKTLSLPSNKKDIGIYLSGYNILGAGVYDFYVKMIKTFSGEFPKMRQYRSKNDITKEERENLNFANLTQPLPPGWELAGPVVIDPDDVIHHEHPDLEKFIDEYIELNNQAIDEHNKEIQSQIDSLLI